MGAMAGAERRGDGIDQALIYFLGSFDFFTDLRLQVFLASPR